MLERALGQARILAAMREPAPPGQPPLSIGEAAQRTGLSVHALRFYEREGFEPMFVILRDTRRTP